MQGDLASVYPITNQFLDNNNLFFNIILVISISYGLFLLKDRGYLEYFRNLKKVKADIFVSMINILELLVAHINGMIKFQS